jgi:DNA-binding transcriptional regulator YiaG
LGDNVMMLIASSTTCPGWIGPENQIISIEQNLVALSRRLFQTQQQYSIDGIEVIELFSNGTNDSGILLRWNVPTIRWIRYGSRNDDLTITMLSQSISSEALLTTTSQEMLTGQRTSKLAPYLEAIQWIKETTGLSQKRIGQLLNVTRQTINNWERGMPIIDVHRQRILAVRDVLERAAYRHPTPELLVTWLDTPRRSDGRTPAKLLEMNEINQARLLAISSPSSKVVRPPQWVNTVIPEGFRAGAERRQEAVASEQDDEMSDAEAAAYEIGEEGEGIAPDEQSEC